MAKGWQRSAPTTRSSAHYRAADLRRLGRRRASTTRGRGLPCRRARGDGSGGTAAFKRREPHACLALQTWQTTATRTNPVAGVNEQSDNGGRGAVDAATQHVKTPNAAGDLAQLQRQQRGAGGHVRRLARHRLRRSPVLVHLGTIGDRSAEGQSAVAGTSVVPSSSSGPDLERRPLGQNRHSVDRLSFASPQ